MSDHTDRNRNNYGIRSLEAHKRTHGKFSIQSRMPLETKDDLSIAYTPGVAEPCKAIADNPETAYDYTSKGNTVAVISDGSAVLGLGNIGGQASMPVMEGKAVLFKKFAGIDAIPLVLDTQDPDAIVETVANLAPSFGGINLEDIAAPQCFEIERRLKERCDVPVLHDDQHGTAIVTLAGLLNSMKVTGKNLEDLRVVINGSGAAGVAIVKLLRHAGVREIISTDSRGIIWEGRENLNPVKEQLARLTNDRKVKGKLEDAVRNADVFIGVSVPGVLTADMVRTMNDDPIIFAMANPVPEIMPDEAREAGARIIATGRSDFANQINNVLAFPGLFRGALDSRSDNFTTDMFMAAARGIAGCVEQPDPEHIIPSPFDERVARKVAEAVAQVAGKNSEVTTAAI